MSKKSENARNTECRESKHNENEQIPTDSFTPNVIALRNKIDGNNAYNDAADGKYGKQQREVHIETYLELISTFEMTQRPSPVSGSAA